MGVRSAGKDEDVQSRLGMLMQSLFCRARSMALSKAVVCGAPSVSETSGRLICRLRKSWGNSCDIALIEVWDPDEGDLWRRIQGQGKIGLGGQTCDGLSYLQLWAQE